MPTFWPQNPKRHVRILQSSFNLYLRSALGKSKAHPAIILTLHTICSV